MKPTIPKMKLMMSEINNLLEAPSFRVGSHQFTPDIKGEHDPFTDNY